ncbi:MAG: tripartite tricarboxylate transporter substrate binding protein, partial [Xanthobacteraceae bacterium]|nr:tripartite tricarboxylate transporter substrate binding protein [Xanthobacteraceae bacterium]
APAGTPADVTERLNTSVARAVQSGALKTLEEVEGLTLVAGAPTELDKYVHGEAARWQDLISKSNLKLE